MALLKATPIILTASDIARFLELVPKDKDPNECWIWTSGLTAAGYGRFKIESGGRVYSHRVSFTVFKGPIPDGLQVCHDCPDGDTRNCWNPEHLWPGTQDQNIKDCKSKGRNSRGPKHGEAVRLAISRNPNFNAYMKAHPEIVSGMNNGHAKVSDEDVIAIRELRKMGNTYSSIARKYPIGHMGIGKICRRERWKHIP